EDAFADEGGTTTAANPVGLRSPALLPPRTPLQRTGSTTGSRFGVGTEDGTSVADGAAVDLWADALVAEDTLQRRQKDRVISIILGNLFTLGILGVFYFNYVLFESYIGVFLYSFLVSEALWDSKKYLVDVLVYINDSCEVSPRWVLTRFYENILESISNYTSVWVPLLCVFTIVGLNDPFQSLFVSVVIFSVIVLLYLLDRRVFWVTKVHRFVLTDDAVVALLLIVFLFVAGAVLTTLFAFFTANDVKNMIQLISKWLEQKVLSREWAQDLWKDVSGHGESAMDEWLGDFEEQYVTNTTWEPIFRWGRRYMEQSRLGLNETLMAGVVMGNVSSVAAGGCDILTTGNATVCTTEEGAGLSQEGLADSWMDYLSLPEWMHNKSVEEIAQTLFQQTKSADLDLSKISGKFQSAVVQARDSFWTSAIFTLSLLFLVIDFGVRVGFFFTITFILLSSEENLMHEILTGFFAYQDTSSPPPSANGTPRSVRGSSPRSPGSERASMWQRGLARFSLGSNSSQTDEDSDYFSGTDGDEDLGRDEEVAGAAGFSAASISGSDPPLGESDIERLELQLRATIEAVFMMPVKMAMYHAGATFLLFKLLGIELLYLAAMMSIVLTVFPLIYAYWVCLPWCIVYALNGNYQTAIALFCLHYVLYYQVDSWVLGGFQKKVGKSRINKAADHSKNEFITGISVFFGVTAFGAHGVLIGPLLVCLGLFAYNVLKDQQQDVQVITVANGMYSNGPGLYAPQQVPLNHGPLPVLEDGSDNSMPVSSSKAEQVDPQKDDASPSSHRHKQASVKSQSLRGSSALTEEKDFSSKLLEKRHSLRRTKSLNPNGLKRRNTSGKEGSDPSASQSYTGSILGSIMDNVIGVTVASTTAHSGSQRTRRLSGGDPRGDAVKGRISRRNSRPRVSTAAERELKLQECQVLLERKLISQAQHDRTVDEILKQVVEG
ncbi:Transmembrane protein 245 (Protein CG-2), partial [Durusdinium trenchii]